MLNKLTIRKQSNYNNLIEILHSFSEVGGEIDNITCDEFDDGNPVFVGSYNNTEIKFLLENDDEIVMHSDLTIDETYQLYRQIMNEDR